MSKATKYLEVLFNFRKIRAWAEKSFSGPSPAFIKRYVLQRNGAPDSTWVETGTFLGETTIFLSGFAKFVYSMEPDSRLFETATRNTASINNIEILNGPSESLLPTVLNKIDGNASFWLDGHFSAENTYQGECDTPIRDELEHIQCRLPNLGKVAVLVDDIRCFNPHIPEYAGYPSIDFLVDWARGNKFNWHIEHDIFIAKNF